MRAMREMAVAEGYWTPEFLQRMRNVDRLAHDLRLDLVRAALEARTQAEPVSLDAASEVVAGKLTTTRV